MKQEKVKVNFKYEESSRAFRMYYEEDSEVEILGCKFKISAGEGPLVENVKSFSGSRKFYIDNNVFIPEEVIIGNNVAILDGTVFSKEGCAARVVLDNNVIIKETRIGMRGITSIKNSVSITSSTIKESSIVKSIIANSIVSESVVHFATISDYCDVSGSTISHANIITSVFEKAKIENCSKINYARGCNLHLLNSVVDGQNSCCPIELKSISFANSEITSVFPASSSKCFPLLYNASIKTMFDACFAGDRFFYKRKEKSSEQEYEYGKLDEGRLFSFSLTCNEIKKYGQDERPKLHSVVGEFIYENFKRLVANDLSDFLSKAGKIEMDLSEWQIVYSSMYYEFIIDIAEGDYLSSSFLNKTIAERLNVDIKTGKLSGSIILIDQTTWLCARNLFKISENIEDKGVRVIA